MTQFVMTPTNIDYIGSVFRNPITNLWTMPLMRFDIEGYVDTYDPLNNDIKYQKQMTNNIYLRMKEKWLYKEPVFRKLLKYFKATKEGSEMIVTLIKDMKEVSGSYAELTDVQTKFIFRFIEKVFITKRLVEKVLKHLVGSKHMKWYDLFYNTDEIKKLIYSKLKKLIETTIYKIK